ncbi:MAG: phosphoribosylglycinamide formyltransferase [Dethiobacter sp.]|jgi:phosphoribosylglycinamide formyltransferase-1|nr:phosphoribosylglycinamide formyltransferase [Dethiobacter sp.]MBS3902075.1 phosphoribosylglycinamide formyltransferase [Dethiobacter sp.]MBS3988918.1 phosphoribosylglycinamide formyltransferase [Dethiobacter sp.]
MRKRIAVLASGSGSNLQAILEAIDSGEILDAEVVLVLSDRKEAYALERARLRNIQTKYLRVKDYAAREEFDRHAVCVLEEARTDLVVLAGYMRLITPLFLAAFEQRVLNIHPSLLPAFPGGHGVADALAYGVKVSGCTVHFVDEGMDTGPILLQEAVPVYDDDTAETLHERIRKLEHKLYPKAINLWVQGKIKLRGRRCVIDE